MIMEVSERMPKGYVSRAWVVAGLYEVNVDRESGWNGLVKVGSNEGAYAL